MKTILIYIGGFISGVVATILLGLFMSDAEEQLQPKPADGLSGLTMFEEKKECITESGTLEVMQVLKPNMALAHTSDDILDPDRILVLLINHTGDSYYDDQKITIPSDKCARRVGTYKYDSRILDGRTVPVVIIE